MEHVQNAADWAKKQPAWGYVRGISSKVKQLALQLTEIEVKVEDATNHEPWGPHGTAMAEITRASFDAESYRQIMGVIARRLQAQGEDWRHAYKALLLLEYLAKHGPQKVVQELLSNIGVVERLTSFQYKDANGKDWGLNVRQRAKELAALVQDADRIRAERQKAKANEKKYTGVSSSEMLGFGSTSAPSSRPPGGAVGAALGSALGGPRGSGKYARGGLGGSGLGSSFGDFDGSSSAGGYDYDAPPADKLSAKEETRRRIEALRQEGGIAPDAEGVTDLGTLPTASSVKLTATGPGSGGSSGAGGAGAGAGAGAAPRGPGAVRARAAPEGDRGPKRLSDVRVDPSIAATFGRLPSPARAPQGRADPLGTAPQAPAPAAAADALDLLGGLDAPSGPTTAAPASAAAAASGWDAFGAPAGAGAPPSSSSKGGAEWSAFGGDPHTGAASQPGPTAAAADPFSIFPSGPSTASTLAPAPQASDPFGFGPSTSAPAAVPPRGAGGPLDQDLFSAAAPVAAAPHSSAQGDTGFGAFGGAAGAAPGAASSNGFAAFSPPSPTGTPAAPYAGALGGPALKPSQAAPSQAPPPAGMVAPPQGKPLTPRSKRQDPFAGLSGI